MPNGFPGGFNAGDSIGRRPFFPGLWRGSAGSWEIIAGGPDVMSPPWHEDPSGKNDPETGYFFRMGVLEAKQPGFIHFRAPILSMALQIHTRLTLEAYALGRVPQPQSLS